MERIDFGLLEPTSLRLSRERRDQAALEEACMGHPTAFSLAPVVHVRFKAFFFCQFVFSVLAMQSVQADCALVRDLVLCGCIEIFQDTLVFRRIIGKTCSQGRLDSCWGRSVLSQHPVLIEVASLPRSPRKRCTPHPCGSPATHPVLKS
jgi:hypothetical protein